MDNEQGMAEQGLELMARPRRLRHSAGIREMLKQIRLHPSDLIHPVFVTHGDDVRRPIGSMPGQAQLSVDHLPDEAHQIRELGIPAVMLFGIPAAKDPQGTGAFDDGGIIQQAIHVLKTAEPELVVITDVCLCEYTDHGHCGVINPVGLHGDRRLPEGHVLNDATLKTLDRIAISHAEAGADMVAPSGMMDGMVASIRRSLDGAGFQHVAIMSYSVKYSSSFYGPFREAAEGAPAFGDRRSHQMDFAESRQAWKEAVLDIAEGADWLMVKPAMPYLDVVARLHDQFPHMPLVAFNVSGEYAMIKAAASQGWLDEQATVMELLTGIKRAGADNIITYHAKDVCRWLKQIN